MTQKIYLNSGQSYYNTISPNSATIIAARRFGKTDGLVGPTLIKIVTHMPRGASFIYGATFRQLLSRTVPGSLSFLERIGFKRDIHFFAGRKAPKNMNFETPHTQPLAWENVIHWFNGHVTYLLSQDVKFSANSLTTDFGIIDEGRSIKKEKFFEEAIPTLSGTPGKFDDCPWKNGYLFVSDMPTSKEGQWILDMKNNMDSDLLNVLESLIYERNLIGARYHIIEDAPVTPRYQYINLNKEINQFRKHAFLYKEFDTIDNIEVVGEDYIRKMKRTLAPIIFQTSIGNKRITKLSDGFYPNLESSIHYYAKFDNSYIDNLRTEKGSFDFDAISAYSCLQDGDIVPQIPLQIAFDYNANINWVVTGQTVGKEFRTLSSFYVKFEKKIRSLMEKWIEYYRYIVDKDVVYYYDDTALDAAYADENAESFAEIIINMLSKSGWNVKPVYIGKPVRHSFKHQHIDDGLTGRKHLFPRFNQPNNEALLLSMESAGIRTGRNGFEKDKSTEKNKETADDPLELRTDGTDAWDTLYLGATLWPYKKSFVPPSGM